MTIFVNIKLSDGSISLHCDCGMRKKDGNAICSDCGNDAYQVLQFLLNHGRII